MHRVTIILDNDLMSELDAIIAARGYQSRSKAIRDLARAGMQQTSAESSVTTDCVAALVYVYDHTKRDLPGRLADTFHHHHNLSVSTMHVHLDHESCLEVSILKGKLKQVRQLSDHVIAEAGVKHGRVVMVPVELESARHPHGTTTSRTHDHAHVR